MAYYLGRDVVVKIATENSADGVTTNSTVAIAVTGNGGDFATTSGNAGVTVTDLTGVDIGIGVQDEDITYMGKKSVLKAEIKKETTCSLTRKKSNAVWEKVFNNARWGIVSAGNLHTGLTAPPADGTTTNYGYNIEVTMSDAGDKLNMRNCTVTGHTVSLNADGTAEETIEFVTQVAPAVSA